MIHFNKLEITEDGKCIIIDAEVDNLSWFKNNYIDRIEIYMYPGATDASKNTLIYSKTFTEDTTTTTLGTDDNGCETTIEGSYISTRHISLRLSVADIKTNSLVSLTDFNSNIFFVRLYGGGEISQCVSCGYDTEYDLGVVYNLRPFYNVGMGYIKALADDCNIDKNFIDYIMRYYAFRLALKTGNLEQAVKYWNDLITGAKSTTSTVNTSSKCGCHGVY